MFTAHSSGGTSRTLSTEESLVAAAGDQQKGYGGGPPVKTLVANRGHSLSPATALTHTPCGEQANPTNASSVLRSLGGGEAGGLHPSEEEFLVGAAGGQWKVSGLWWLVGCCHCRPPPLRRAPGDWSANYHYRQLRPPLIGGEETGDLTGGRIPRGSCWRQAGGTWGRSIGGASEGQTWNFRPAPWRQIQESLPIIRSHTPAKHRASGASSGELAYFQLTPAETPRSLVGRRIVRVAAVIPLS